MARRSCALSNGALSRLTRILTGTLVGARLQIAAGACAVTSFISGTVMSPTKVMSNSPATKASTRVERLVMMRHSIASRYGWPFFQ